MKKFMVAALLPFVSTLTAAQSGTYSARLLTPETALKATVAALEDCRKRGSQVAVAVVDRSGVAQAMLRDRFAGPHTVSTAINKAYSAISFRIDTLELAKQTQSGLPSSGVRRDSECRCRRRWRVDSGGRHNARCDRRIGRAERRGR